MSNNYFILMIIYNKNCRIHLLILSFTCFLLCGTEPNKPVTTQTAPFQYSISLPALHKDSLSLAFTAYQSSQFLLPFHFFDNPLDSLRGPIVTEMVIIDSNGDTISPQMSEKKIGPLFNTLITIPNDITYPVHFQYSLDFSVIHHDTGNSYLPRIHFDTSGFLMGAYIFILPYSEQSLVSFWRTPTDFEFETKIAPHIPVYGVASRERYHNVYELLFVQINIGKQPVASGSANNLQFVYLEYFTDYDRSAYPQVIDNTSRIFDEVSSIFGPFTTEMFPISIHNMRGALEGVNSFTSLPPKVDTNLAYGVVLAHEAIHHFVGITTGDYDDPWWKEGVTSYLGMVTAVRLRLYAKEKFKDYMLEDFDFSASRYNRALSDPYLRAHLFPDTIYHLVYRKGAHVTMLLDLNVRKATNNKVSIDNVMANLTKEFRHQAFYRSDLIAAFEPYGQTNISQILETYVDAPGASVPDSILEETFFTLDSLGAF